MTHTEKKSANHALYINLQGYESDKAKSRVISKVAEGTKATKMNLVIMKAEVLRHARATRMQNIKKKLNESTGRQRYLGRCWSAPGGLRPPRA